MTVLLPPLPVHPSHACPRPCRQYYQDVRWSCCLRMTSQDDGAGWQLLQHLVGGTRSAAELAASLPFCESSAVAQA